MNWKEILKICESGNPVLPNKVLRTDEEWRKILPKDVYYITRQSGTERPFSSDACHRFDPGLYGCRCCDTILFDASSKFDSGTGWPSFNEPYTDDIIAYTLDVSHGMRRVEVTCNRCDAHLGHVFPDGPSENGLRYCINAKSLKKNK